MKDRTRPLATRLAMGLGGGWLALAAGGLGCGEPAPETPAPPQAPAGEARAPAGEAQAPAGAAEAPAAEAEPTAAKAEPTAAKAEPTAAKAEPTAAKAGPDTGPPTWPADAAVTFSKGEGDAYAIAVSWPAATDDVGVTSYRVFKGDAMAAEVGGDATTATIALGGAVEVRVEAGDAAGGWSTTGPKRMYNRVSLNLEAMKPVNDKPAYGASLSGQTGGGGALGAEPPSLGVGELKAPGER